MLDMFSKNNKLKTFKLCVDGKKLNASSKSMSGGVDLFGFEDKPTAKHRLDILNHEHSITDEILKVYICLMRST